MFRLFLSVAITAVLLASSTVGAAAPATGFVDKIFKDADGEHKYVVFVPQAYKGDKEFPVILFLHGSGETKGSALMPVQVGIGAAIKAREKTFPFITVIPQSEKRTWQAGTDDAKRALGMLDAVCKEYKTDTNRLYLTGLSMGGFGTWSLAAAFPDKWAAIVPICGAGDPKTAEKFKDVPCWCFHGDKDTAVPVNASRVMIKALEAAGGKPKYSEFEGAGHNSWDKAYGTDELYTWLLAQKKKK